MSNNYVSFKKYPDAVQAQEVEQLLVANGIACLFVDNGSSFDSNFGGAALKDYEIQILPQDFEKAEALLQTLANDWTNNVPSDYYLFTFTDEELYEVLEKKDEWSEFDYVLAKKILSEKGKSVDSQKLMQLERERLLLLAKPDDLNFGWIIAGYLCALVGGLFGVITGYLVYTSKKTLPNGTKVYTYTTGRRAHAKNILILGLIVLVISAGLRIFLVLQ